MRTVVRWTLAVAGLVVAMSGVMAAQPDDLDALAQAFWAATSEAERAAAIEALGAAPVPFDRVVTALRAGRGYVSDVETGRLLLQRRNRDGQEFPYLVYVPEGYDARRSYSVRVYLHGGVMRPRRDDGRWWRNPERYLSDDTIVVFPTAWSGALWWQRSQIENLGGLLNDLKRRYNVDEDRVFLLGVSDGGTGAFYHAFKAPTPWAGFLSFIGHPGVLAGSSSGVDGEMHVTNLTNKPFFVVNGGRDPLYPVTAVEPYIDLFHRAGVAVDFHPQPDGRHDMNWWSDVSPAIETFIAETRRDPLPDRLSWRTERTDAFNRVHWLVVEELGDGARDRVFPDIDVLSRRVPATPLGLRTVAELDGDGLRVMDVGAGSVLERAGIRADDVIVSMDGRLIATVDDLRDQLIGFAPGDELPVVVDRSGGRLSLRLVYPTTWTVQQSPAFERRLAAGRVDLQREGNTVTAVTAGVRRFTVLLSPDQFNFAQPIRVVTNGVVSHDGLVRPETQTLLRWAARDQDRRMLFGAELRVNVDPPVADELE